MRSPRLLACMVPLAAFALVAAVPAVAPAQEGAARTAGPLAVASENELAARAALEAMKRGGSAADGAVAGSLMLDVAQQVPCGLGGGGFAMVWSARDREARILDYRETAPAAFDVEAFKGGKKGAAVGVPGEVAGVLELHRRWGRRPLAEDADAAIHAAEQGFPVSAHLASAFGIKPDELRAGGLGAIFAPAGRFALAGETVRNPALGATLRRIVTEGERAFYAGAVAAEMVDVVRAAGGALAEADLAGYRPIERQPLRGRWGSREIVTMPLPSAGGIMLLQVLGMFDEQKLRALGDGTAESTHFLAEAMRGSLADRIRALGDPAFVPDRTAELLAPDHLARRRARIARDRTHAPARFEIPEHGTTHLVVADREGNVVSLTTTINAPFGATVYAPRSGVLMNDELHDFTSLEQARKLGLADGGPNRPRASARPISSMSPTLVLEQGRPVLALGGSGGLRIGENVVQTAIGRLVFGKTPEQAVSAPRFFAPPSAPALMYGASQMPPPAVADDLRERGEQVQVAPWPDTSGVQMVAFERQPDGAVRALAGADPRKGGTAIVEP